MFSEGETDQWKNLSAAFPVIQLVCRTVVLKIHYGEKNLVKFLNAFKKKIHYGRKKRHRKDTSFDLCGTFFFLDCKYIFFPLLEVFEGEKSIFPLHVFVR